MYIIVQHLRSPQQIIRLHFTFTLASPSVTPTLHALLSACPPLCSLRHFLLQSLTHASTLLPLLFSCCSRPCWTRLLFLCLCPAVAQFPSGPPMAVVVNLGSDHSGKKISLLMIYIFYLTFGVLTPRGWLCIIVQRW